MRILVDFLVQSIKFLINRTLKKLLGNETISVYFLRNTPIENIRKFLGPSFLSPIQKFAFDGYNNILYQKLNLTKKSIVVVLGGYLGDSAYEYIKRYDSKLLIYEPINQYYVVLQNRFRANPKVLLNNFAVSNRNGFVKLRQEGETTGLFSASGHEVEVKCIDIFEIVSFLQHVDLMEINIEGGEYDILFRLFETQLINRIQIIQIQFHNLRNEHELQRSIIRSRLSETHELEFNYDWIWERWVIKQEVY